MNLLVAGGLLVLGVLALIALVFVIRSEPRTGERANVPPPVPTRQKEPTRPIATNEPSAAAQTPPVADEDTTQVAENRSVGEWHPLPNGQFYELVNELRDLRGQTQQIEYRLSTLIDMVERVEQAQNGRFPIEEDASDTSDTQTTN